MRRIARVGRQLEHFANDTSIVIAFLYRTAVWCASVLFLPSVFHVGVNYSFSRARFLLDGYLPYRDFIWEYPPLTTVPLLLAKLTGDHWPYYLGICCIGVVICEFFAMQVVRRMFCDASSPQARRAVAYWTFVGVPFGALVYFHFDYVSVLLMTLGLVGIATRRGGAAALAAGVAMKVWPGVGAMAFLLQRRWSDLLRLAGVVGIGSLAFFAYSPKGFLDFLAFRQGKGFQVESTVGAVLVALKEPIQSLYGACTIYNPDLEFLQPFLPVICVGIVGLLAWRARDRNVDIVALLGTVVTATLVTNRLLSPQFIVWLLPFVALLAYRRRAVAWCYAAVTYLTLLYLPLYHQLYDYGFFLVAIVLLRNALLVWLLVVFWRATFAPDPVFPVQARPNSNDGHGGRNDTTVHSAPEGAAN